MGWSGGTEIFDRVSDSLMYIHEGVYDTDIPMYQVLNVLENLKVTLEAQDWDTPEESKYWHHFEIGKILGNKLEVEYE
jgi:hypothetical protein